MYRRYRKYRRYRSHNEPPLLGVILLGFIWLGFFLGKLIFRLTGLIFHKVQKGSFKLNEGQVSPEPNTREEVLSETPRYELKASLLTDTEKKFRNILEQVVGDRYLIEDQVQLSRIVHPIDSNRNFINYPDLNRIKAKSIDFVLYDKNYKPYVCIELDDRSHLQWKRMKRDAFVNDLMKSVGLRIIRIPVAYSYDPEILKNKIFGM